MMRAEVEKASALIIPPSGESRECHLILKITPVSQRMSGVKMGDVVGNLINPMGTQQHGK